MTTPQSMRERLVERLKYFEFLKDTPYMGNPDATVSDYEVLEDIITTYGDARDAAARAEERERIKRHIREWDNLSRSDAEFAGNVRHYFSEILFTPTNPPNTQV